MSTATKLITANELLTLPGGRFRYELVKGELLTMSPSGEEHGAVIMNLAAPLGQYVKANKLGRAYGAETGFKLESDPDTVLAPDIAFIKMERLGPLIKSYRVGAPDLVVEVISPGESKNKVEKKTSRWLQGGALAVWLVDPHTRTVSVWRLNTETRFLSEKDLLSGDDIVPGFSLPVSEIFI
ncbi:MAG: Uma2 family endonuclease [Pyrinomonadaceae bacterium]|nr:Uma2 family endonuclease [Pyrinomonadaceae bacterium]